MKYKVSIILLIIFLVVPFNGLAEESDIKISINGNLVKFSDSVGYPFTDQNGRTQVPFRITLEKYGAKVSWDEVKSTAMAEKDGIKLEVPIGKKYIVRNDHNAIPTDTAALIKDGKTYLPIRAVIEALGGTVSWNSSTNTVIIENIINKDILSYNIPHELGMPKLSKEEINKLVGAEPSIIQSKISTVYDLLQYMISANYATVSGDSKINESGYTWSFNRPAESTIRLNKGNCGATSNFVNYILKGDYEEVGYIDFSADTGQGGHVFNYIKNGGKYYIIDFLQYAMSEYKRYNYQIVVLDKLEDYPEYCIKSYGNNGQKYQIKVIVSYMSETQLPIACKNGGSERVARFLPKGNNVKVLYQTPSEGKIVEFINPPTKEPNWDN